MGLSGRIYVMGGHDSRLSENDVEMSRKVNPVQAVALAKDEH